MVSNYFYKRHWMSDEKMAAIMLKFYHNKRLEEFQQGAAAFYQEHLKPRLAPNILQRVERHHQEGHILVLISGSIRYLLEPVAADLGFDHLLCTLHFADMFFINKCKCFRKRLLPFINTLIKIYGLLLLSGRRKLRAIKKNENK